MAVRQAPLTSDVPLTSSRALRLAMTRAADKALGLSLSVTSVGEETLQLEAVIETLPNDYLYSGLLRLGEVTGFIGLDAQMRAAVIEMQTIGSLSKSPQIARSPTTTDMVLAAPVCEMLLKLLPETTAGSDLDGWVDDVSLGDPFDSLRSVGLALEDADYRLMRLTIDLDVGERLGEIILALPNHTSQPIVPETDLGDSGWDIKMNRAVINAPATLDAILCRMKLTIGQVNTLQVGDVLPLYGATVSSVRLFAPEGVEVGSARLGQSGGLRAVRLETPVATVMRDIPPLKTGEAVLQAD
jgi:flagellar motor switch protein FliM